MSLDTDRLENVKYRGDTLIARCPACADENQDRKGEHLFINAQGRFGCVINPGPSGKIHRKRIFELVGVQSHQSPPIIKVNRPDISITPIIIQKDVLGHLGRLQISDARIDVSMSEPEESTVQKAKNSVPGVPPASNPVKACCDMVVNPNDFGKSA